ncbi:MAG: beta-ketoacyl-[acyl-carrier-protein] synthase family protein [Nocardioides sp.]|jgi:3-oxoacyl-[acyl-carrier-protein] synthase II
MGLDVAITGIGAVSALGFSPQELFDRLAANELGVQEVPWTKDDPERFEFWAPVEGFTAPDWMQGKKLEGIDPFAQHAGAAVTSAVADSGLERFESDKTGIVIGTSKNGTQTFERAQYDVDRLGREAVSPKLMIQVWPNMAASQIAMNWELHGPCLTLSTACASSLDAIGLAARMIASGEVDVAIAGGTEGGLAYGVDGDFVPASAYSRYMYGMGAPVQTPDRACLPFDRNRGGMVMGEGAGMFILESAEHALTRGARVHAWVQGWGSSSEAYHPSSPNPSGEWERLAMSKAAKEAGVDLSRIDMLAAHSTGTPKGDVAEINAINDFYGDHAKDVSVMSIKGTLGHPAGAAGALSLITALEGSKRGLVMHTGGTTDPEENIEFDLVLGQPKERAVEWIQTNAFGFGGQNASLIVSTERHDG